jgi:hypothetical protein
MWKAPAYLVRPWNACKEIVGYIDLITVSGEEDWELMSVAQADQIVKTLTNYWIQNMLALVRLSLNSTQE